MRSLLPLLASLALFAADAPPSIAPTKADVPYAGTTEFRQTLNVYAPATRSPSSTSTATCKAA